jgi:hypothetical protein
MPCANDYLANFIAAFLFAALSELFAAMLIGAPQICNNA